MNLLRQITLWRILKAFAIITLVSVVFSVIVEAYNLQDTVKWVKDRVLNITWDQPSGEYDHYRIEISKTDLLKEPVTTYLSYDYTESNEFEMELEDDHSYQFRIQAVSNYGVLSNYSEESPLYIFNEKEAAKRSSLTDVTPIEFSLSQNYPNPFNAQTSINYQIPSEAMSGSGVKVQLVIYNLLGQRVRVLVNEIQTPGTYSAVWNGRDDSDQDVASGHYIYQLTAGSFKVSKKMIYMQ